MILQHNYRDDSKKCRFNDMGLLMADFMRRLGMAERTGLEPATTGVTGRYSNQLNYHSKVWWVLRGSNPRPSPCKGDALPAELSTRLIPIINYFLNNYQLK